MSAPDDEHADVVVIGGGPAGSTTAALLKKYYPELDVCVIEQAAFPRHHIGESLIIENNRILADMGALDAVASAGFLAKGGATFVWGDDRTPWSLLFGESRGMRPDAKGVFRNTWHVERSRYDALLLDVARSHGARVLQPARVESVVLDDDRRVTGVRVSVDGAPSKRIDARFVIDAGGRSSLLARHFGKRVYDPVLRNVGVYGYWKGARLDARYAGTWELSFINVVSIPHGWIWFIPVRPGVVSVGVVVSHATYKARASGGIEAFYRHHIETCPEVREWLAPATLEESFGGAESAVNVEHDFNYRHDVMSGPGYALVGDAAGFVDPLFSIGVFLAQSSAQLLAYVVGTALRHADDVGIARLLDAYDHHTKTQYDAFRAMAYVFYGFNSSKEEWWKSTRAIMRSQALPDAIGDREAFLALTFGFGANLTLFREAISCFGGMAGPRLRDALLGGQAPTDEPRLRDYERIEDLPATARPRVKVRWSTTPSVVPLEGTGRVAPMTRVALHDEGPAKHAEFPRYLFIPDEIVPLLARLDGTSTVESILSEARALRRSDGVDIDARPFVRHVLKALRGLGVLEVNA